MFIHYYKKVLNHEKCLFFSYFNERQSKDVFMQQQKVGSYKATRITGSAGFVLIENHCIIILL